MWSTTWVVVDQTNIQSLLTVDAEKTFFFKNFLAMTTNSLLTECNLRLPQCINRLDNQIVKGCKETSEYDVISSCMQLTHMYGTLQ